MSKPTVFLTGATGLVGSFLASKLLHDGYDVKALKRNHSSLELVKSFSNQIQWIEGDVLDADALEKGIQGSDFVIHAAAIVSFNPKDKEHMMKINVEGTKNMVNLCLKLGTPRFCFVSSIAALGRVEGTDRIDEETKWKDSELNSNYAISKYQAELEVWRGIEEGLNAVIVNPSTILGPGDWNKSSTVLFKFVDKGLPFYPTGTMSVVDVRDVVDMTISLMISNVQGRYILSNTAVGYKELFGMIAHGLGKKPPYIQTQHWMNQIVWRLEYVMNILWNHDPMVTKEIAKLSKLNAVYINTKVTETTGLPFRPVKDSIAWCCQHFVAK